MELIPVSSFRRSPTRSHEFSVALKRRQCHVQLPGLLNNALKDHLGRRGGEQKVNVIIARHLIHLRDAVPQLPDQALHIRQAGQRVPAAVEDLQLQAYIGQLIRGGRGPAISQRIQPGGAVVVLLEFACGR